MKLSGVDPVTLWCRASGLPEPEPEYLFASPRRWRFDFAFIAARVALEIEGGAWSRGRHTRGKGFLNDMAKYNEAVLRGWRVIRVTPQQIESGEAFEYLERALRGNG